MNKVMRDYDHVDTTHLHMFRMSPWVPVGIGHQRPPRAALIFDCGTGQTKGMLCLVAGSKNVVKVIEPQNVKFTTPHAPHIVRLIYALFPRRRSSMCDTTVGLYERVLRLTSFLFLHRSHSAK